MTATPAPAHRTLSPSEPSRPRLHPRPASLAWVLGVFAALPLGWAEPTFAQGPPQPTAIDVLHRSGQSFVTWTEVSDPTVIGYRVYRHDAPIDASNLQQAALLWELGPDSGAFHADRYLNLAVPAWGPRYLSRYVLQDLGPELPTDRGFLAWTLAADDFGGGDEGSAYYAVTAVDDQGIENTLDFGAPNVFGPVLESIAPPEPVRAKLIVGDKAEVYIQYLDLRSFNPTMSARMPPTFGSAWTRRRPPPSARPSTPSPMFCSRPLDRAA
jgi:hypothetical protein